MADQDILCPKCHLADRIRAVSAIVREGTTTSEGTAQVYVADNPGWTPAPYSGTQISGRAKDLALPSKPELPSTTWFRLANIIGLLFFACGCIPAVAFIFLRGQIDYTLTMRDIIIMVPSLIIGLVILGGTYFAFSNEKRKLQERLDRWKDANKKWNQLYYCERDDILFNPSEKEKRVIPVTEMQKYLYS